jgi:hypothetical protein
MSRRGLAFIAGCFVYTGFLVAVVANTKGDVLILMAAWAAGGVLIAAAADRIWPSEHRRAAAARRRAAGRRSGWGRLWLVLFIAFNLLCAVDVLLISHRINELHRSTRGLGHLVVATIGNQKLNQALAVWVAGAVLLGILVWLARVARPSEATDAGAPDERLWRHVPPPPSQRG